MKLKLTILAVIILGMSACTQRTFPTHAKEDVKQDKVAQEANV